MTRSVKALLTAALAALLACSNNEPTTSLSGPPPEQPVVIVAAGDIAYCASSDDEATATLIQERPSALVLTLGDHVYESGSATEFTDCYEPSWGPFRSRTRPAPGNHDYATTGASGYFGYFGAAAGDPEQGYYSYDVGRWHVVALNSNCTAVPCAPGSEQERWLREDLAAHPALCTLAYWHHPRFSSGTVHGSSPSVAPLWQALYDGGADVVLAGHEHNYERLVPLDPDGNPDEARGIRSFVVGTGGRSLYPFGTPIAGSEVRNADTYGILQLTLYGNRFEWQFVPAPGASFADAGSASCH